jgi:hypothetical protein
MRDPALSRTALDFLFRSVRRRLGLQVEPAEPEMTDVDAALLTEWLLREQRDAARSPDRPHSEEADAQRGESDDEQSDDSAAESDGDAPWVEEESGGGSDDTKSDDDTLEFDAVRLSASPNGGSDGETEASESSPMDTETKSVQATSADAKVAHSPLLRALDAAASSSVPSDLLLFCSRNDLFLLDSSLRVLARAADAVKPFLSRFVELDRLLFCELIPQLSLCALASSGAYCAALFAIVQFSCGKFGLEFVCTLPIISSGEHILLRSTRSTVPVTGLAVTPIPLPLPFLQPPQPQPQPPQAHHTLPHSDPQRVLSSLARFHSYTLHGDGRLTVSEITPHWGDALPLRDTEHFAASLAVNCGASGVPHSPRPLSSAELLF